MSIRVVLRRAMIGLAAVVVVSGALVTFPPAAVGAGASDPIPAPGPDAYTLFSQVQLLVTCNGTTPTAANFSFTVSGYGLPGGFDLTVGGTVTGPSGGEVRSVPLAPMSVLQPSPTSPYQTQGYAATVPLTAADLGGVVDVSARDSAGYEYAGARTPAACGLTSWNPFDGIQNTGLPGLTCDGRASLDLVNKRTSPVVFTYVLPRGLGAGVVTVPAGSTSRLALGTSLRNYDELRGHSEITRPDGTDERVDAGMIAVVKQCRRLDAGETLGSGQSMDQTTSADPRTTRPENLVMQTDGNLVLYLSTGSGAVPIWYSGTDGHPGATATMQTDGNLVVSSPTGQPLWWNRMDGTPAPSLQTDDQHGIVEYSGTTPVWDGAGRIVPPSPASGGSVLTAPGYLLEGDQLVNGPYTLVMQQDGNLVEYVNGRPAWYTATARGFGSLYLQGDGNLVVRRGGAVQWNSGTYGHPGDVLRLQSDGNVVLYDQDGRPLWWTGVVR